MSYEGLSDFAYDFNPGSYPKCGVEVLDYLHWHTLSQEAHDRGEQQQFCAVCHRWAWPWEQAQCKSNPAFDALTEERK